jgi:MFS family permease
MVRMQQKKKREWSKKRCISLAFIVVALVLSIFLVTLDMTIVATSIPQITTVFNSLDQVGWYGSAFFLTLSSFQPTWGKAYEYFPLKSTFLLSIIIFELGSLIAQSSTALIVGRAITGAGAAGIASDNDCLLRSSTPTSCIYRSPRCNLFRCQCHWTSSWWSLYKSDLVVVVVSDHFWF